MLRPINIFWGSLLLAMLAVPVAAAPLKDNGTGPDGTFIFPKTLALRCDISSSDIHKEDTVKNCLNKILRNSKGSQLHQEDYQKIFYDAYHEMNSKYMDIALNKKSAAGDTEDRIDELIKGDDMKLSASDNEETVRRKLKNSTNLSALGVQSTLDILDVYNSKLALEAMHNYYGYEFGTEAAAVEGAEETK